MAQGRVVERPPFGGHETSSRRCPLSRGAGFPPKGGAGGRGATLPHPVQSRRRGGAGWDPEGKCPLDLHPSS